MNRSTLRNIKKQIRKDDDFRRIFNRIGFSSSKEDSTKLLTYFSNDEQLRKKLNNNLLPSNIIDFNKRIYYCDVPDTSKSFTWTINLILNYKDYILKYIDLKNQYEHFLFKCQYEEASKVINQIEEDICLSVWSFSQRMLLGELQIGLEENKKLLEKFTQNINSNILVSIILEFNSNSSEKNMSYLNYQDKTKKFIDSFEKYDSAKVIQSYLNYKLSLDFSEQFVEEHANFILQFDSQLSIIDLYNSLIELIQYLEANESQIINYELLETISILNNDFRIQNLLITHGITKELNHDPIVISIIEKYTAGEYSEIINSGNLHNLNILEFQLSQILIKSHIINNQEINNSQIFNDFYNIFAINENYKDSLNNTYLLLKVYKDSSLKWKLLHFIKNKIENKQNSFHIKMSYLNDRIITPSFSNILSSTNLSLFLDSIEEYYPLTTTLFKYKHNLSYKEIHQKSIDPLRFKLFKINNLLENQDLDNVIQILNSIPTTDNDKNLYLFDLKNRLLFQAYFKNNCLLDSIEIIVNSYFKNKNLIKRFPISKLAEAIKRTRNMEIKKNIMYPILFFINSENDYKLQRIALSNFLDANNIRYLDDLLESTIHPENYYIYFLHKICIVNNLKRDMRFAKNSEEAETVRIQLLNKLINLNPSHKKIYFEEINNIMTKQGIKTKMKQINESRIYIDVDSIKSENYEILAENYKKYLLMKNFDSKVKGLDISNEDFMLEISDLMNQRILTDVQFNQEVIILKSIITRIIEEFLFNEKYGLDTFLSSRIRHGYINSQLTSLFYEHNLMSKSAKETNDDFTINEYLDEQINYETDESKKLRELLSEFTKTINSKVSEVKNNWISIKYSNKNVGVFDYSKFIDAMLVALDFDIKETTSFDVAFDIIISSLTDYTSDILSNLRNKIKSELKLSLLSALNELELQIDNIQSHSIEKICNEIRKNINLCKVKTEGIINEFSEIFYLRDLTYVDFNMEDLVSSCREIIAKLNKDFNLIQFNTNINYNPVLKGHVFLYFVDILIVFLNNAIEHSKFPDISDLKIDLMIEEDSFGTLKNQLQSEKKLNSKVEKSIIISVRNNLHPSLDIDKVHSKIDSVFKNTKSKEMLKKYTRIEGGSGFYKVVNTLSYNINTAHSIYFEFEENSFKLYLAIEIDNLLQMEYEYENINN